MPHYRILPGNSFRDADGSVKGAGEVIELDEQMARLHAGKVDPKPVPAQPAAADVPPPPAG